MKNSLRTLFIGALLALPLQLTAFGAQMLFCDDGGIINASTIETMDIGAHDDGVFYIAIVTARDTYIYRSGFISYEEAFDYLKQGLR